MKVRTLILIGILVLVVMIITGSCATRKKAVSPEDASAIRSGKWINERITGAEMTIFYLDGRYEIYITTKGEKLYSSGTSAIYESWRDSDRILWCRARYQDSLGQEGYMLVKISNKDNTLELLYTTNNVVIDEWNMNKGGYNYIGPYRHE